MHHAPRRRQPGVSLLLPNRNNARVLDLLLERLVEHTTYENWELVVVDDDSTDGSRELLRRWGDSGRIRNFTLLERDHSGVAASLNAALDASSGEWAVSLDGDATVETPGWLDRMIAFAALDPAVGVVTAAIDFDSGRVHAHGVDIVTPEGLHDRPSKIKEPVGRRTLHIEAKQVLANRTLGNPAEEVDASIGCCMLFRRAIADELGGYDLGWTPVWFEDLDLSLSARRLGAKVFVLPEVRVLHRAGMRGSREAGADGKAEEPTLMRRAAARMLPRAAKEAIAAAIKLDPPPPETYARFRHHYDYWREKWGFDLLNPDMDSVLARYGGTEVCWRYDDGMRAHGERVVAAWEAPPPAGSLPSACGSCS
jgi:GT2 family glycosyltransferase